MSKGYKALVQGGTVRGAAIGLKASCDDTHVDGSAAVVKTDSTFASSARRNAVARSIPYQVSCVFTCWFNINCIFSLLSFLMFLSWNMPSCAVAQCPSRGEKGHLVSFFKFPRDPNTRAIWVRFCTRKFDFKFENATICELHFEKSAFSPTCLLKRSMGISCKMFLVDGAAPTTNLSHRWEYIEPFKLSVNIQIVYQYVCTSKDINYN